MISGSAAANHYGYSSARVKAMQSVLISKKAMQDIVNAKDASAIISILFHGEYKPDLEEFGGLEIKGELVDFALSKNLAKSVGKLVRIAPYTDKKMMRAIVGKWNLYNAKMAIEAKDRKMPYESIARYLIDYGRYDSAFVKEAMKEDSVEGLIGKFMINSPYRSILSEGLEAYRKTRSGADAVAAIDMQYYMGLGGIITKLRFIDNNSARIMKMDIDLKNVIHLVKAKRLGLKFSDVSHAIIPGGNLPVHELEQAYSGADSVDAFALQVKGYDLKPAADAYKEGGRRQLLLFEIGMRNAIFESSKRLLNHSILSFGAMLAYAYMKEIESFTLRVLINSKLYGLAKEDVQRLIIWKNE